MLSIGLIITLVGFSMAVEVPGFVNNTQCVYVPSSKQFSCQYGEHKIECPAVANFSVFTPPTNYHLFGIGRYPANTPVTTGVTFPLYPRGFDNVTYVGSTFGKFDIVLYYGENFVNYGIRVIDPVCYKQIVELFGTITDYHDVTVGNTTVSLIGEVLYSDSTVQKRWLWGYGFGYGYPYYGWGGLYGMGLGMYYPGLWWGK